MVALLPKEIQNELFSSLSDEQWNDLQYDWGFWARPQQLPPTDDNWLIWFIISGRGFGKTRTGAEFCIDMAKQYPGSRGALVGQTVADVRDIMVRGESGILESSPPWFMPKYTPSKRLVEWPNGSTARTYTGQKPDMLRGPQHHWGWSDELAKYQYPDDTWDNLELGMRLEAKHATNGTKSIPRIVCTTTPKPIPIIKELRDDAKEGEDVVLTTGTTYENIGNLAPTFKSRVVKRYEGTQLGLQELYGYILDDDPNALWSRDMFEDTRVLNTPKDIIRIAIGVDPPGGVTECGIAVCGLDTNLNGYLLEDLSVRGKPHVWAEKVVAAYQKWKRVVKYKKDNIVIIAEKNHGGDMVESTLRGVFVEVGTVYRPIGESVPIEMVHASKGKKARAEPISALYHKKWIHNVGTLGDLEDECCSWVPGETTESPNRLDAMVWGFTRLMLEGDEPAQACYFDLNPFYNSTVDEMIEIDRIVKEKSKNGQHIPAEDVQDVEIVRGK